MPLVPDPKNCDISVKRAIQGLSKKLGYTGSPTFANTTITNVITASTSVFSKTCEVAAGLNVLRVTGLQTDDTALTGTLRGAYIDVSNGSTVATGTIRGMELKARTEAPGDSGSNVAVLEGLSISADSKAHNVTTMRAAEFILDGKTAGTIDEAVGLRIANNLQVDKATLSYGLQIYRDSFDYTYDISLSLGGHITGDSYVNQDLRIAASPQFAGLTITGNSVFGLNSSVFQPNTNSTTFFQVLDADGGTPIFNVDTTNERVGIGTISPYSGLHYQGDIFYLTPAAGPESNDNITIKNYATGNGAPDIILRTADIAGAYGIGVGTLSLIGGSKTTHYGGIGHGGGKISLQGGQGRDAANDPSYYAPVLLQPTSGNVGIGTTAPNAPLEVKGAKPGVVGDFQSGQLQVTGTGGEFYCAVITGHNSFNTNTQLWYLGSTSSATHDEIAFINRQNAAMHFYTNNTSRMTIDATGNVTLAIIAAEGSDVDKFLVSSSGVVKYRTGTQVLSDIGGQTQGDALDDLSALTPPASDGQFIVATGIGAFQYESGATVRTSLGLAIGTNVQAFSEALKDLDEAGIVDGDSYMLVGTGIGGLDWETTTTLRTSLGLGTGDKPTFGKIILSKISDNTTPPNLVFVKERTGQTVEDNDYCAQFVGQAYNDAGTPELITYTNIRSRVLDASNGTEDGQIDFRTIVNSVMTTAALFKDGSIFMENIKSGTDQANAGAAADELYHDTDDNSIKIGV